MCQRVGKRDAFEQLIVVGHWGGNFDFIHVQWSVPVAAFGRQSPACTFNQNAPHGLGGGPEEMGTSAPLLLIRTGQAKPGFMDERGGLQGLSGFLLRHLGGGELAQFFIHQWK